jgi:hypothetical protein
LITFPTNQVWPWNPGYSLIGSINIIKPGLEIRMLGGDRGEIEFSALLKHPGTIRPLVALGDLVLCNSIKFLPGFPRKADVCRKPPKDRRLSPARIGSGILAMSVHGCADTNIYAHKCQEIFSI